MPIRRIWCRLIASLVVCRVLAAPHLTPEECSHRDQEHSGNQKGRSQHSQIVDHYQPPCLVGLNTAGRTVARSALTRPAVTGPVIARPIAARAGPATRHYPAARQDLTPAPDLHRTGPGREDQRHFGAAAQAFCRPCRPQASNYQASGRAIRRSSPDRTYLSRWRPGSNGNAGIRRPAFRAGKSATTDFLAARRMRWQSSSHHGPGRGDPARRTN